MRLSPILAALLSVAAVFASKSPEEILSALTIDEKIGQMVFVYYSPPRLLSKYNIGGVLIPQNMVDESLTIRTELARAQKSMKIPLLTGIDQEGGKINRLANIRRFSTTPSAFQLSTYPPERIAKYAFTVTDFLLHLGINTNLAPCIDPAFGYDGDTTFMFIRQRSHGSSPDKIVKRAGAFLEGVNRRGGISILKHFPGYDTRNNSDVQVSISTATRADLESYMAPFRELSPMAGGLMMNNIIYRNVDSLPAVLSAPIVAMARELGGDKVIMTDDLWAVSLREFMLPGGGGLKSYPDASFITLVKKAFLAGNDIFLITYPLKVPLIFRAVRECVAQDSTARKRMDESVLRILKLKKTYLKKS